MHNTERPEEPLDFHWLLAILKPYSGLFLLIFLASVSVQLCNLAIPLSLQVIFDKVIPNGSISSLYLVILSVSLIGLFQAAFQHLRAYALAYTASGLDMLLGSRVYEHLVRLPIEYFDRTASGQVITRLGEIDSIRLFLTNQATTALVDALFFFIYFFVLVDYSLSLSLLVLLSLFVQGAYINLMRPQMKKRSLKAFQTSALKQDFVVESLHGMLTLKSEAAEPDFLARWKAYLKAYADAGFRTGALGAVVQPVATQISSFTTLAILFFGTRDVIAGRLTIGELLAFNMIVGLIQGLISRVTPLWQQSQDLLVSLERLTEIMMTPEEDIGTSTRPCEIKGGVSFRNVEFRYPNTSVPVLRSINLEIQAGQVIGIVGPSGSGKSTLVKLIQRLYSPQAGQLLLDGFDITEIDPTCVRKAVGIVLQESTLFCRSVHDNIALSNPDLTREDVRKAALMAGANDFITNMPCGFDSLLEQRGTNLSHGQRQRVALARVLAHNPRILILDEATSAVDHETELAIQENLPEICHGRTVLIISHRLPILQYCDRIIVMRSGQIIEDDTHAALLSRSDSLYCRLWRIHSRGAA